MEERPEWGEEISRRIVFGLAKIVPELTEGVSEFGAVAVAVVECILSVLVLA